MPPPLPEKPIMQPLVVDHRIAPGCFDILGRGRFPPISLATAMAL
jgi:hypothetical protein